MLKPRYYFANDFRSFYEYFLSQPHTKQIFQKGNYLWKPGQPYDRIQYYVSGASVHFSDHESGRRKIISFHGPETLLPGYHTTDFRIELSLTTIALSEVEVLEFTIPQFRANLPRAVKGKKAQKKEKHDFREKGIAKQASTLRRPRNKEITINL